MDKTLFCKGYNQNIFLNKKRQGMQMSGYTIEIHNNKFFAVNNSYIKEIIKYDRQHQLLSRKKDCRLVVSLIRNSELLENFKE